MLPLLLLKCLPQPGIQHVDHIPRRTDCLSFPHPRALIRTRPPTDSTNDLRCGTQAYDRRCLGASIWGKLASRRLWSFDSTHTRRPLPVRHCEPEQLLLTLLGERLGAARLQSTPKLSGDYSLTTNHFVAFSI